MLFKKLRNQLGLIPTVKLPDAGVYHFRRQTPEGEARMHLRIEGDGSGFLLVNASRIYHFNPTATLMAYLSLSGIPQKLGIRSLRRIYQVPSRQAHLDFEHFSQQIQLLTTPGYERIANMILTFLALSEREIKKLKQTLCESNSKTLNRDFLFDKTNNQEMLLVLVPQLATFSANTLHEIAESLRSKGCLSLAKVIQEIPKIPDHELRTLHLALQSEEYFAEPLIDTVLPFSKRDLTAPYRMDLALTYRCNNQCLHCYNPVIRQREELDTLDWKRILDQLWRIGIPHIIFTGGEPTLRPDLPELIAHAESNGQITGINTNGRRLKDSDFLQTLVKAGLDHIQITLESHDPHIHDRMVNLPGAWEETVAGIRNAVTSRLYVMTNTTLLQPNYAGLKETLDFLATLGVKRVGLNALIFSGHGLNAGTGLPESTLPELLTVARESIQKNDQKLTWYTPTQYCHFDPVLFDQQAIGVKGCTAALYNMCVEPDGNILPCQSYYQPLGNLLIDPWEKIWNNELAIHLRQRDLASQECQSCVLFSICGGGCPLAHQAGQLSLPKPIQFMKT